MRARFWRNVTLIALAHVAALIALLRWAGESRAANAQQITWLSGADEATEADSGADSLDGSATAEPQAAEAQTPAKSEIVLPSPTAAPSCKPSPKPSARAAATPRKRTSPKPSATVTKNKKVTGKKSEIADKMGVKKSEEGAAKISKAGSGDGASGPGAGKSDAAIASYYGSMLHDRFYRAWAQPQTVVASGVKLSALARIRIEKDGRVSDFKIVRPSGNVLVDESVAAVSRKVTQVDALPAGVGSGGHYDVNINFALNSE